jgi:hypothetical protein
MQVINLIPKLRECLDRWTVVPSEKEFLEDYVAPNQEILAPLLYDFEGYRGFTLYSQLGKLPWDEYRAKTLRDLDARAEEANVRHQMAQVTRVTGIDLEGEVVLFGAFRLMDGYARFHNGRHRVFLGLDEPFVSTHARDILVSHELAHVARETRPEVWGAHGLSHVLDHDHMVEVLPVVEHLFNEGFACLVSEDLNPNQPASKYTYQTAESFQMALTNADSIDATVKRAIEGGHYRELYDTEQYAVGTPRFAHYIWAWQWVKSLHKRGLSFAALTKEGSATWITDALQFRLANHQFRS